MMNNYNEYKLLLIIWIIFVILFIENYTCYRKNVYKNYEKLSVLEDKKEKYFFINNKSKERKLKL